MTDTHKPMDARTEQALRESIAKWEKNAAVTTLTDVRTGSADCSLCALFNRAEQKTGYCIGCPVSERTQRRLCRGTPYDEVDRQIKWESLTGFLAVAQREVDFLKSLLPETKP